MSQIFSAGRFSAYLNSYFRSHRKSLLSLFGRIPLIFLITGGIIGYNYRNSSDPGIYISNSWNTYSFLITLILFIGSALFGSGFYSSMSSKNNRMTTLLIPASQFEKYLANFVIYTVGFYIIFFISALLGDAFRVLVTKIFSTTEVHAEMMPLRRMFDPMGCDSGFVLTMYYLSTVSLQAIFALGSIVFMRYSFAKSALACFIIWMVGVILSVTSIATFFHGTMYEMRPNAGIDISEEQIKIIVSVAYVVFSALVYWLTYARAKESEIVERW